ncbi:MAG: aminotransferase class V-fold PLP-dependent enzyme [Parcubacteria group bacterium]|nr:aminotransferase class V-fold PLP-dependent enzyme [Parcubacteria group bacterium]
MKGIYLDHAATTPISKAVLDEMMPYLKGSYGNASSIHALGQTSREAIDESRERVARFLNCLPSEIVFTGSATESDNIAILGIADFFLKQGKRIHIITSKIEHPAVLNTCEVLDKRGVEVDYCNVGKDGVIDVSDIEKLIKENTVLVSIMYANNEIGTIQPIIEIGKLIQRINQTREQKICFHTDAVQAVNYLSCDVKELGVDFLTLSAHKIYGPKGVGVLYTKQGTQIEPIVYGGHQEAKLRPGTENTANIVGLGRAIEDISTHKHSTDVMEQLRDKLMDGILNEIKHSRLNGSIDHRLPNNINVSFDGAEGEALVIALDQKGIATSTGSACSSGSLDPSHVLLALGLSHVQAHGSLRMTLGRQTTEKDIDKVLDVLTKIVKKLRTISGYKKSLASERSE